MISSVYNIYLEYDDKFGIIYNCFTGAILKAEYEKMVWIKKRQVEHLSVSELNELKVLGILVEDDIDEKKIVEMDRISGATTKDVLTYRILTTTSCNAKCFYCYEEKAKLCEMSIETAKEVSKFITSRSRGAKKIQIQWFGGEPLMNGEVIDLITRGVYEFSLCNDIQCNFTMISNAILFDEKLIEKAKKEWHLKRIQITLDGEKEEYEERKGVVNSFERVIKNIYLLDKAGIYVSIRLNYDANNLESIKKLIIALAKAQFRNVHIYPYPLFGTYSVLGGKTTTGKNELLELYNILRENDLMSVNKMLTKYKSNQCFATALNSFVIYPDGKLYKCVEDVSKDVGDVWHGVRLNETYYKWCSFSINEGCKDCKYLPLCQGGCRAGHLGVGKVTCFLQKDIVKELVIDYVKWCEMCE